MPLLWWIVLLSEEIGSGSSNTFGELYGCIGAEEVKKIRGDWRSPHTQHSLPTS
jgi:hypothetical protein